jgi:accessory colonization factor AcfC
MKHATLRISATRLLGVVAALSLSIAHADTASSVIHVYGPGGPAPAMKEAARAYGQAHQLVVEVTAGPTPMWVDKARADADVVFSGAENMMSDYAKALPGAFDLREAEPLYLRPAAILVRPGNPKGIKGFRDLLAPGVKVLPVAGAGQVGLWEDVAGRTGDIDMVRSLRKNIILPEAANSAAAKDQWVAQKDIDAWLIWNIWQVSNPALAQVVPLDEPFRIYRDVGVVLTSRGKTEPQARGFVEYLESPAGAAIFARWGWSTR